jgi:hypothetical protein
MKLELKGITGAIAVVALLVGGVFYTSHRRASLREQGLPQVERFLESELAREMLQETKGRYPRPDEIAAMKEFEILEFQTRFFPRDPTRVRVLVRTQRGERTYHFRFKRVLGSWKLERETRPGLFSSW